MWVEESGGAEVPGPEGTSDELLITVEGEQYAAELNKVFNANYAKENHIKPFSEVMVGKLIIE